MKRILIIEDKTSDIPLIQSFCRDLNLEATIVEAGRRTIEALQAISPHMVLININTPLFDGLATTIELRALQNAKNEQMMIIGLNGDSSAVSNACRIAGMNHVLTAPLQPERLLATLRSVEVPLNFQTQVHEAEQKISYLDISETARQHMAEAFGPMPVETPYARIYFTNFYELQEHFGNSWPGISAHVETITCAIIEQSLGEGIVYKRLGELNFLLMTPGQTETICALKSQSIVREICRGLAMDEVGAKFQLRYITFFGTTSTQERSTPGVSEQVNSGSLINPDILPWTRLTFWPVWDAQNRKFSFHAISADRDSEGMLLTEAIDAIQRDGKSDYFTAIDISTIAELVGRFEGLEPPRMLALSVHVYTLENHSTGSRFLYYLEKVPKKIRERLVIDIHGVSGDVRAPQIAQYQKLISMYCFYSMIVVSPLYRNFSALKALGNQIVGIKLAETEVELQQELEALQLFGALSKRSGLAIGASMVRNRQLRDWGLTFCRYVSGPAIAPAQTHPCSNIKLVDI